MAQRKYIDDTPCPDPEDRCVHKAAKAYVANATHYCKKPAHTESGDLDHVCICGMEWTAPPPEH